MSHPRFICTLPQLPPGFEAQPLGKRLLLARPLVVMVSCLDELQQVLPDFRQRQQGVICLPDSQFSSQALGAQLWCMRVPPQLLPSLQLLTQVLLDSIEQTVASQERQQLAEHTVNRQQFELETLRQDYHRATTRLQQQIQELSRAEAEVRQSNELLEQRVAQRTAELEQLNRELESFSYSVSHDLRAPLRAIVGFTQNLQEDLQGRLDALEQQLLQRIIANGLRMNQLIDDLLALARASQQPLQRGWLDLSAMASEVFERLCSGSHCQAHVDIQTGLHVSGDSRLIGAVLENLIGNAIKFSRNQPQPQIWLSADASGDEVVFQLRDNGAGFDMQWQGKLFKVFQRLHKETEFEGTGIGLATVQRVIARHGGRIWVQAAPGQGASFFFTLPDGGQ